MERLTERDTNGTAMAVCCGENCKRNFCCENGGFAECGDIDDIIDRLASIEDILGDEYDLDELREMVQAKRKGRCVVLPCKIFDKIWDVIAHYQFEVTEIDLLPYGKIVFRCGNKDTDDYAVFYEDDLGDTFVLAEPPKRDKNVVKEAEAALRREQDGE